MVTVHTVEIPIEQLLVDTRTGKNLPALQWIFTGSARKKPDPESEDEFYGADLSGTLIAIFPVTNETVFQSNLSLKDEVEWKLEGNRKLLPDEGTDVELIIRLK